MKRAGTGKRWIRYGCGKLDMLFGKSGSKDKPGKTAAARGSRAGPTIITGDVVIEGKLFTGGELQIDGTITGHVRARAVVVDVQGVVNGEVAAEDVFIRGRVVGSILGVNVTIVSGGHVEGDVTSENVVIENGAYVDGKIHHSDSPLSDYPEDHGSEQPGNGQNKPEIDVYDDSSYRSVELKAPHRTDAAE